MFRQILDGGIGGLIGFGAALVCAGAQLETRHFPLLATVTSGTGIVAGLSVGGLNRHLSRKEQARGKYLPVANLNSAISRVSDRYAQLPGQEEILIALGQLKDEVWLPPR